MSTATSARTEPAVRFQPQLINGAWVEAVGQATFEVTNPFDDSVYARVPASSRADMARAVAAADAAQPAWAAMPPAVKQGLFLRAADLLESRTDEIVRALAEETGSGADFASPPGMVRIAWRGAQWPRRWLRGTRWSSSRLKKHRERPGCWSARSCTRPASRPGRSTSSPIPDRPPPR